MFRLLRYFSIASLLSIIAASLGLSLLHRKLAIDDLVRMGEAGNREITQTISNAFGEPLRAFIAKAPGLSAEQLHADADTARLFETIRGVVKGTSVIKFKAYTLDGRTVFSSESRQIGEDKSGNAGFKAAKAGEVATEMTHRDHFSAFEQQLMDRGVLSTYLPLRAHGTGPPEAVFEVYQDITPFLTQIDATQRTAVASVVAILLSLYGVLFLIVRRADRILRRQNAAGIAAELRVQRYLALSKLSSDWFWDQDAQFRFIELDASIDLLGGISRDVHFGHTRWDLPHTEPVNTSWDLHRAELMAHRPFRDLLLRRTPPSGVRYVNVSGEPVFAQDGSFAGYRGVASDVTERVEAEMALASARDALTEQTARREHSAFLQALLDALPVGVSLVNKDMVVAVANEACLRLLQLPAPVFGPGASLESAFRYNAERGDYGAGDTEQLVAARIARWRDPTPQLVERLRSSGVTVEIRGLQLPDGSKLTTYTDITERKQAEHALLAAKDAAEAGSRAKSAFLAVMSHEIRTPMNAVLGLLELLSLSPLDAQQRDTVKTVRDSSKSLLRLIDDVLDFSKIEAGKLELHEEAACLVQMFDAAHQTFSGAASKQGVLLVQRVDARIAPAHFVDRLRLRQIVNNFLSNAIKFTERGQVELVAELVERQALHDLVRITVRDSGVGMGAATLERLFKPFSQAEAGIERRYGGTGLGLSICQRLAELMGTTIAVSSEPAVGTCVSLTLRARRANLAELQAAQPVPAEAINEAVRGRVAPTIGAARADQRLVLVVDDHPVNRRMLARQLNILGYAVQTAADGHQALALWRGGGFGLLVTDCQMPGMDGYQLAAAIRASDGRRLPIVACTANVSHEAFAQCRAVGMDEVLAKPIELAALQRMLDRWLPAEAVAAAANDAAPSAALSVDFAAIAELAQGDGALERELLDDFLSENARDLAAAAQAIEARLIDTVYSVAHRIKGAARTVGAGGLSQAAESLEAAVHASDWQRVSRAWQAVRLESERIGQCIARRDTTVEVLE